MIPLGRLSLNQDRLQLAYRLPQEWAGNPIYSEQSRPSRRLLKKFQKAQLEAIQHQLSGSGGHCALIIQRANNDIALRVCNFLQTFAKRCMATKRQV